MGGPCLRVSRFDNVSVAVALPNSFLRAACRRNTEALELVGQISAALTCVHQHRLVHRDVKPANVMLTANHRVAKLIDLGTVRWLDDDSGVITEVGTQIYAAPEHYSRARLNRSSL